MTVLGALSTTLLGSTAVTDLIGQRLHTDVINQDSQRPAALMYVVTERAENCLNGFVGFETATVRIEAYGRSRLEADLVMQAIKESLNGLIGVVSGTPIRGISQNTGIIHLVDKPNDGTDQWQFRSVQSFDVSYNSFEGA